VEYVLNKIVRTFKTQITEMAYSQSEITYSTGQATAIHVLTDMSAKESIC